MDEIEIAGALRQLADGLRRCGSPDGSAELAFLSRGTVRCWLFATEGAEFFDGETMAEVIVQAQAWIQARPRVDYFAAAIGITPDGRLIDAEAKERAA